MKELMGITNELTLVLQRKEHEIENAMRLVNVSKQRLQSLNYNLCKKMIELVR